MEKINIQLYSVKNSLDNDYKATLKALSDMGYDGVEFAGNYGGYTGKELSEILDYYGLSPVCAHLNREQLENNLDYHLEILRDTSCRAIMCAYADVKSAEQADDLADFLVKTAEKCAMLGFEFGYHNHAHEFEKDENGVTFYDRIMDICGPLVLCELDLGWVAKAGLEPEKMIRKYAGRVNFLHLKQFANTDEQKITTLDNGIVDVEKCIKIGSLMGCRNFIIEQDNIQVGELEDAKTNIDYIHSLKV